MHPRSPGGPLELRRRRRTRAGCGLPAPGASARPASPRRRGSPWSRTAIRWASRSASSRSCVVRKIVTPSGDEVSDGLPHHPAAAWIEAGRGLVEEDDPRVADEGHGEVEPPLHASRVGRDGLLAPRRPGRTARAAPRLVDGPRPLAEVPQVGHQLQVLLAGEELVDRRELAGDADDRADRVGLAGDVVAGDLDLAAVGGDQGREDPDRRSSCRRRSARGGRRPCLRRPRDRCRRGRHGRRRTCATRSRGSRPGTPMAVMPHLPRAGRSAGEVRCRGLRPPAAGRTGDHVVELGRDLRREAPRASR